ncbi:MAG: four helix bundle protein [Planctomycetota bacterium]
MAREAFETLPLWKAALRLATDAHRVAARFPADEKSGLGAALKKLADAPATIAAHADASESPEPALAELHKCEAAFRELLSTALLAHRLEIVSRAELRRFRLHVARLRRMVAEEIEAWEAAADEQRRDEEAARSEAATQAQNRPADHEFDPRDQPSIQRELDLDDVDAIGLTADQATPSLKFPDAAYRPQRKRANVFAKWFGFRQAA